MANKPGTVVGRLLPIDLQETNERRFSRKHINDYIRTFILEDKHCLKVLHKTIDEVKAWLNAKHYPKKTARLAELAKLDIRELVLDLLVHITYYQEPELFTGVTGQMAYRMGFVEKRESIQTVAECLAVMCEGNGFDIFKESKQSSMMLVSTLPLPRALEEAIDRSTYLPPMVCEPNKVTNNFESGYLTHNDCIVLGKANGHTGDLCLDVINTQNSNVYQMDLDFLCTVEEEPTHEIKDRQSLVNWNEFKAQSYELYTLLAQQGNRFWFTHKVDKRGRLYSQGYHLNPQGTAFKKAMLELKHKETVKGVPDAYKSSSLQT